MAACVGLPNEIISTEEAPTERFVADARRSVRLNHLSSGPGGDDFASGLRLAGTAARYLWSGVPLDWVFEPISHHNGYDDRTGSWSFDRLLAHVNAWGVPADRLPAVLGRDGGDLCGEVITDMAAAAAAGPFPPERQSAVIRWDQRVRNHLAAALHQTSFVSWPLMPATDRRLFATTFGLPLPWYAGRHVERAVLQRRRPDLAEIPLDSNSFSFEPLAGTSARRGGLARAGRSLSGRLRRVLQAFRPTSDPRRYERLFHPDHPRWRAVRHAAEPLRSLLHQHLDAAALATVLPPPDRRLRSRSPLRDGSPIRLLCGLAFVLDRDARS